MRPARGTIVFLTSDYADYSKALGDVVGSVVDAAGLGMLCVVGRGLSAEPDGHTVEAICNAIYGLVERIDAAGLICESGTLGHETGPEAVARFLTRYHLPCVSLGREIPGTPSVLIDDSRGMRELTEHLVSDSRRRRFAFVKGLPGDTFSEERETIFRDVLRARGREIDESLFVFGNYDTHDAYEAVARLLRAHPDIDTISCANDVMALGAARAIRSAGLTIPHDIALSGFDDAPDATRCSPALTTVRQPMIEMAEIGIARLFDLIESDTSPSPWTAMSPSTTHVDSELILRGSTTRSLARESGGELVDVIELHRRLVDGISGLRAPDGVDTWALVAALHDTLARGSSALAGQLAEDMARIDEEHAHWFSNVAHQMEELSRRLLPDEQHGARMPLITAALAPVRERLWAAGMDREFAARRRDRQRSNMQLQIGSSTGIDEILGAIERWVTAFAPRRFYLVRYQEPAAEPRPEGRLICAFREGRAEPVDARTFATRDILPQPFADELERGTLVLAPVHAGTRQFGYLMIDPEGIDLSGIGSAAHCIGNAMRSQYLIDALESRASQLRDANVELSTLANSDVLTGLANRLCFEHRLNELCARRRSGDGFGLFFLDLDGFKAINDTFGHETGDAVLQSVAARLDAAVGDTVGERGLVARLGGDEFTVIVDRMAPGRELDDLVGRLLDTLTEIDAIAGRPVQLSASIGGALFPEHGHTPRDLLDGADAAMYEAKSLGKNGFVLHRSVDGLGTSPEFVRGQDSGSRLPDGVSELADADTRRRRA